ncbi:RDD family protein [Novosphingobium album (ex Liu et al. 2023)]|uniref:RDD family protein n=1 Tax=Novosphingobium album (ex Liu et al. 2023) TaxID=3031130 RepID=A0ABT5WM02_9SPHN|nr:RDD family protein [Novosphingobium album (ex Liu et al. 2023)]MDE8651079.1 RDD family protein [Novosphingobium album (ex Liu et al. 2023)]
MSTRAIPTRLRRTNRDRIMVTPEGIALPVTVASRGSRAGALLIDLMLIGVLMIATTVTLIYVAGGLRGINERMASAAPAMRALELLVVLWTILMFLFRNAYFLYFELGPRGATPGKRLSGIRIAARDGGRLTAEMVIARNLLRDIELFLPAVFLASAGADSGAAWIAATAWFLIFALFPLFNRDRLRAGDVIAGSWVVETPRRKLEAAMSLAAAPGEALAPVAEGKYRFDDAELAVYGEYELQTLERVLREKRAASIEAVYLAISGKIGRNDGWNDERAFLEAYYTQLRARLEAAMRMGRRKADKFSD